MDLGLDQQSSKNLKLGQIYSGQSARYETGGGIQTGPGFRLIEDFSSSNAVFPFEGTVFPALWCKVGTNIQQSLDPDSGTFWGIGLTLTAAQRGFFVEQGNGDIHYINNVDNRVRIAVAQNTVAILATDTEITVSADWIGKFAASGTIYIRGDSIAYTGVNATQLTGVTGIQAGGHPIDSIVTQTTTPGTLARIGTFCLNYENRMLLGGRLREDSILFCSAPEDDDNPAFFYDFDANGTIEVAFPTKLRGGVTVGGSVYLAGAGSLFLSNGFDVTTGQMIKKRIVGEYGIYNERCIVSGEGVP